MSHTTPQNILIDRALVYAYIEQLSSRSQTSTQYTVCGQPRSSRYCPLAKALDWKYDDIWEVGFKARRRRTSGVDEMYELEEDMTLFTVLVDSFKDHRDGMWYGDVRVWHVKRMLEQVEELMKLGEYHRVIQLQEYQKQWRLF